MALDTSIINASNLIATGPTPSNTAVPSRVTQLAGQNVWEYEFSNTWPQTGVWVVTLNADGFSIPKGTVLGSFSVTQGTVYKMAVNWSTTENVETLATKVTALETTNTTLGTRLTAQETASTALGTRLATTETALTTANATITAQAAQIATLTTRLDDLEVQVVLLTP